MLRYMIRRILQAIPTILGVTMLSFLIITLAPGDPIQILTFGPGYTAEDRERLAEKFCLDRNPVEQYVIWMVGDLRKGACEGKGILRGDFGVSLRNRQPVYEIIAQGIRPTLELTTGALLIGVLIGALIGVLSALKHGSWFDNLARFFSVIFDAVPSFWMGLILIMVLSVKYKLLPVGGRLPINDDHVTLFDRLRYLVMPSFVLAVSWIALISRLMRAETLEVIGKEYVRTARAKGLSETRVNFVHAARNALIPVVTFLGPAIVGLMSGAVVVEQVFSWPGIGRITLDAVNARDYPIIMCGVILAAVIVVLGNLLTDLLLALVDPRIRFD
ncbi:MAG: ABC transporter permease [Candidatus Promineifilaceae bacterium]